MDKVIKPILMLVAVIICLFMLRLGVWQLDRADQKQTILDAQIAQTQQATIPLSQLQSLLQTQLKQICEARFRPVSITGQYLADATIFIDNKVLNKKVGYQVFTPFQLSENKTTVMVNRGWVSVGESRDKLPPISTPSSKLTLKGRLNLPPQKPPLWDDKYPVAKGRVWQYLPITEFSNSSGLTLLPLVVELAPIQASDDSLIRQWQKLDDIWVGKHKAYAMQWFAMALALLIASLVLAVRSKNKD